MPGPAARGNLVNTHCHLVNESRVRSGVGRWDGHNGLATCEKAGNDFLQQLLPAVHSYYTSNVNNQWMHLDIKSARA